MIEKDFTNETLGNIIKEVDFLNEPIPICHGDCGATNLKDAKSNLGIMENKETSFVTGLSTDMEEIDSTLEAEVTSTINKNLNESFTPRNRTERRAWERELKKKDKKKRVFADNIRQAAERLAYTEMIQRVRKINEEIEKEGVQENEATN